MFCGSMRGTGAGRQGWARFNRFGLTLPDLAGSFGTMIAPWLELITSWSSYLGGEVPGGDSTGGEAGGDRPGGDIGGGDSGDAGGGESGEN